MKSKILVISAALLLASCKSKPTAHDDLNYMQNIEKVATDASVKNSSATLQVGDQLIILITAKNMDVVKPFNQNYSSSEMMQTNTYAGTNTPNEGLTTLTGPTYIVDAEGNVDFPILGKLSTTNKSLIQFKDELRDRMTKYVINPTVSVRLANFKVTVLGEVSRQGDYTIANGQATILNAIALAGDLTMYGKREDILVVRTENGVVTHGRINLLDANLVNSPYYNLRQGDAVIVSANKTRDILSKQNPNTSLYLTAASIAVTAVAILVTLFKK